MTEEGGYFVKSKILKIIYIVLGFLFLGLGALGVALPILPTTPFLLLASYCFAKGSDRFHNWFISTKLYKNHLEEFIKTKAMTLKKKLSILLPVSAMLITTAIFISNIYARIGIFLIIVLKYYYFFAHISTVKESDLKSNKGVRINEE